MADDVQEGSSYASTDISETLLSAEVISSVDRLRTIGLNLQEPYRFVGFPTGEKGISYYVCPFGCFRMAIPVNSTNKDGAWFFISSQLGLSSQLKSFYNLPINYDALLRLAEERLNGDEYTTFVQLLETTRYCENAADHDVEDLIINAGRAFLAGQKTAEETVELIQSKVSLLLAEKG